MRSGDREEVQEEEEDGNPLVLSFCYFSNLLLLSYCSMYLLK